MKIPLIELLEIHRKNTGSYDNFDFDPSLVERADLAQFIKGMKDGRSEVIEMYRQLKLPQSEVQNAVLIINSEIEKLNSALVRA